MVVYDSAAIYIDGATSIKDKIVRIDSIINALLITAAESASTDNIEEYQLDDGQTKIKTIYRGTDAIFKSIKSFETLREMYRNKLNGRVFRLVDSKSFRR